MQFDVMLRVHFLAKFVNALAIRLVPFSNAFSDSLFHSIQRACILCIDGLPRWHRWRCSIHSEPKECSIHRRLRHQGLRPVQFSPKRCLW
jgi:hypothetical protein